MKVSLGVHMISMNTFFMGIRVSMAPNVLAPNVLTPMTFHGRSDGHNFVHSHPDLLLRLRGPGETAAVPSHPHHKTAPTVEWHHSESNSMYLRLELSAIDNMYVIDHDTSPWSTVKPV